MKPLFQSGYKVLVKVLCSKNILFPNIYSEIPTSTPWISGGGAFVSVQVMSGENPHQ